MALKVTDILIRGGGGTITFSDGVTIEFIYQFKPDISLPSGGRLGITLVGERAQLVYSNVVDQSLADMADWVLGGTNLNARVTALEHGGSISPLTTKGDLWGFDTANNRIPVGANGQVLTADSTQALGVKWATPTGGIAHWTVDPSTRAFLPESPSSQDIGSNDFPAANIRASTFQVISIAGDLFGTAFLGSGQLELGRGGSNPPVMTYAFGLSGDPLPIPFAELRMNSQLLGIVSGAVDPSAGGLDIPAPALYVKTDGTLWSKTGVGATQWTQLGSGGGGTDTNAWHKTGDTVTGDSILGTLNNHAVILTANGHTYGQITEADTRTGSWTGPRLLVGATVAAFPNGDIAFFQKSLADGLSITIQNTDAIHVANSSVLLLDDTGAIGGFNIVNSGWPNDGSDTGLFPHEVALITAGASSNLVLGTTFANNKTRFIGNNGGPSGVTAVELAYIQNDLVDQQIIFHLNNVAGKNAVFQIQSQNNAGAVGIGAYQIFTNSNAKSVYLTLLESGAFSSFAGKNGYFNIGTPSAIAFRLNTNGVDNNGFTVETDGGMTVGVPTGGSQGSGTINVATDIFKNGVAYTNPKWVLQHYYSGEADKEGLYAAPSEYHGLMSIEAHEEIVRTKHDLPLMLLKPGGGYFERGDLLLASVEEAYLYIYKLNCRIAELEKKLCT